jgi:succinoglycan biosynthesis protein ExoM
MTDGHMPPTSKSDHISVCICTYKRPQLLKKLLLALEGQRTDELFTFSAVVVDNDSAESAREMVTLVKKVVKYRVEYYVEPRQNIALARNKAVLNAQGDFIAMIDDDEFPCDGWLINLFKAFYDYKPDIVIGPIKPHFEQEPPRWLVKGRFCERASYGNGSIIKWDKARTGNVLLRKDIFEDGKNRFPAEYGRSGGEDIEFFRNLALQGRVIVWCEGAAVHEIVLPERLVRSYYLERNVRIGGLYGEKVRKGLEGSLMTVGKFAIGAVGYSVLLPGSFILGEYVFLKCLMKVAYFWAWILGFFGLVIMRNRRE